MSVKTSLYEKDFFAWSNREAALLRAGKLSEADIAHIAEEIESMGKTEKRELVSRLKVLLLHLLKWQFQPERRSTSWRTTIEVQRIEIADHLEDNPSLVSHLDDAIVRAWRVALPEAAVETGLPRKTFPAVCPWRFGEMVAEGFWPE